MEPDAVIDPVEEAEGPPEPLPKAAPIESRFLYVDVAAMRAKQLRRGARPRINRDGQVETQTNRPTPHKAERIAMEEVRENLVLYEFPHGSEEK